MDSRMDNKMDKKPKKNNFSLGKSAIQKSLNLENSELNRGKPPFLESYK